MTDEELAAAPELLDAAKVALAWLDMGYWSDEARATAAREGLRTAIAKADLRAKEAESDDNVEPLLGYPDVDEFYKEDDDA